MKILFGIQATGNGHISRCRTLAKALAKQGASVDYIFSGRDGAHFFDMHAFGDYKTFRGMSFISQNGKIKLLKTGRNLHLTQLIKDIRQLKLDKYDLIISDFEPITAWSAKFQKKLCLEISNQAASLALNPKEYKIFTKCIMKYYAPNSHAVGLHWFHFGRAFLPPMVDELESQTIKNNKIIIYLPVEKLDDITKLVLPFSKSHQFECYHPSIKEDYLAHDILFKSLDRAKFTLAVSQCDGVITNSGFGLISEALTLGKKILTKPMKGQAEQQYNARCLDELGLATVMKTMDHSILSKWLDKKEAAPVVYPNVADELAKWIVSGQNEPIEKVSKRLWQQTKFPPHVLEKIRQMGYEQK